MMALLYHDLVEPGQEDASGFPGAGAARYKITVAEFRDHLRAIAQAEHQPVATSARPSFSDLDSLLLTVDDGGISSHSHIADLLEVHGWRGHFFVTTDFIDTPTFLSAIQIRDLANRGHAIGSHSCSHPPRMALCGWDQLVEEWSKSRAVLSDILGEDIAVASVPGGYYSLEVAKAAAHAGVRVLFNSEPTTKVYNVDDCMVIGRYTIYRSTTANQAAALANGKSTACGRQALAWQAKKLAKRMAGAGYLSLRQWLLSRAYART